MPAQGNPANQYQPFNNGAPPAQGGFVPQSPPQNKTNTLGIISLALGIISIIIGCAFSPLGAVGLVGLVLAILSMRNSQSKGLGIAGLILAIIALFIAVFGSIYFFGTGFYQEHYFGR